MTSRSQTARFRKATASAARGNCVEVKRDVSGAHVRNSKDRLGPQLHFSPEEWKQALKEMRNDPTAVVPARGCSFVGGALRISALGRQKFAMRRSDKPRGGTLYFTSAELDAFLDGVRRGEFDLA